MHTSNCSLSMRGRGVFRFYFMSKTFSSCFSEDGSVIDLYYANTIHSRTLPSDDLDFTSAFFKVESSSLVLSVR